MGQIIFNIVCTNVSNTLEITDYNIYVLYNNVYEKVEKVVDDKLKDDIDYHIYNEVRSTINKQSNNKK